MQLIMENYGRLNLMGIQSLRKAVLNTSFLLLEVYSHLNPLIGLNTLHMTTLYGTYIHQKI